MVRCGPRAPRGETAEGSQAAPMAAPRALRVWSSHARSHVMPAGSATPELSVMTSGNWAPETEPAATTLGADVIVILSSFSTVSNEQVAFVPQMMSATVLVVPPPQVGGPPLLAELPAVAQSLSVTR